MPGSGRDLEAAHELVELLGGAGEADDCSATAATSEMPPSARWDSAEISCTAPAISATRSVIDSTAIPITSNASRACSTVATPSPVRFAPSPTTATTRPVSAWISEISDAISAAAPCEPSASLRTSSATTAKPAPASPARAASTAALSARMFVWNAISSIVLMIFAMLPEETLMASMARFMSLTSPAPVSAADRV